MWTTVSSALAAALVAASPAAAPADTSLAVEPARFEAGAEVVFRLRRPDLGRFIEAAGGRRAARRTLAVVLEGPDGETVAAGPEVAKVSPRGITFRWTAPPGAAPGAYEARVLLGGAPLEAEARFEVVEASPARAEEILRAEVEAAVRDLFEAYEREDAGSFEALVHRDFSGTAENGVALVASTLRTSLDEDFRNYDEISFDWTVSSVRPYGEDGLVEAEVTWSDRRKGATGANAGVESRRTARTSTFIFRRDGAAWRLTTWRGAAAFGLSAPL